MTPLEELIELASGDETPVATLLRKAKVIAARLQVIELEAWVEHELVGYPEDAELPEYRAGRRVEVLGTFSGPFGSGLKNAPIPPIGFPAGFRNGQLFNIAFPQSIAEIEQLASSDSPLEGYWQADALALVNTMIQRGEVQLYEGMGIAQAWQVIPPQSMKAIVDTVRTRILDLALSLERIEPQAGERGAPQVDQTAIQQLVMNVYGGNVAVASHDFDQSIQMGFAPGDVVGLVEYLRREGVEQSDLDELTEAIEKDGGDPNGSRVQAWLGRLMMSGGVAAASTAGTLAAKALAHFFGVL